MLMPERRFWSCRPILACRLWVVCSMLWHYSVFLARYYYTTIVYCELDGSGACTKINEESTVTDSDVDCCYDDSSSPLSSSSFHQFASIRNSFHMCLLLVKNIMCSSANIIIRMRNSYELWSGDNLTFK